MKALNVKNMSKGSQKGFTIIELVVVILLLGILTATALPRFLDVTDQAHDAVVSAVEGGLVTSGALFHAQWVADNQPGAGNVLADFGDGLMQTSATGYPLGLAGDPDSLAADTAAEDTLCENLFDSGLQAGHPTVAAVPTANTAPTTVQMDAATTDFLAYKVAAQAAECSYVYVAEGSAASNEVLEFNVTNGELVIGTPL